MSNHTNLGDWLKQTLQAKPQDFPVVTYREKEYSYADLSDHVLSLAAKLQDEGIKKNEFVAVFMEHCYESVVAILAIMVAGAGYMPLEIVYPVELIEKVLADTDTNFVLTQPHLVDRLPHSSRVFGLDSEFKWKENLYATPRDIDTRPEDYAFVVMSSGSTGAPKAIVQVHRAALHAYRWRLKNIPYQEDDREAVHVFFVWEFKRAILGGVRLFVIPDEVIYDPLALCGFLEENKITRMLFTSSLLDAVLEGAPTEAVSRAFATMRHVIMCGEVVTVNLAKKFWKVAPNCKMMNLYSVSECHDVSCGEVQEKDFLPDEKYASCGPLMDGGVKACILDIDMKEVPPGEIGELYVRGPGVGLGYLKQPKLTAERFFLKEDGLMFRTGDNALIRPDNGHLEVTGRCAFMIKIRGYSIVPEAVEHELCLYHRVAAAVVLAEGDEGDEKKLVAHIVPQDWSDVPSADSLRKWLKIRFPHYSIPSIFYLLDSLPINKDSGKLDRKALKVQDVKKYLRRSSVNSSAETSAINTPELKEITEQKNNGIGRASLLETMHHVDKDLLEAVVSVWTDVLKLEPATIIRETDDFWESGGHSLLAAKFANRVSSALSVEYTIRDLLNEPKLGNVIHHVTARKQDVLYESKAAENLVIDFLQESVLDPSVYPAPTRKSSFSRFRVEFAMSMP
eukprot:GHVP01051237.1.p1 GENE.GHVP01051237.1~~GHVP01051237.1.p1  ORF type:complete len:678 (+),score=119.88 GHVP01051237.1:140-2173(+)